MDRALKLRRDIERVCTALLRPSKIDAITGRNRLNRELKSHWPDREFQAHELILEDWDDASNEANDKETRIWPQFVVFIDEDYDIDWFTDSQLTREASISVSKAETVGARRCKHLPRDQQLEFRRLVGLAIADGIRECVDSSENLTQEAARFLEKRTVERSRSWTLCSAHIVVPLLSLILWLIWPLVELNVSEYINNGQLIPVAMQGALVGAYLSVLHKAGKGSWDAASGRATHGLEVLTKLSAGAVCGFVAFMISRWSHAPSSIQALGDDIYSLFLFGVASGLVERMVPKIISAYVGDDKTERERKSD